jgi:ribonuclease Z
MTTARFNLFLALVLSGISPIGVAQDFRVTLLGTGEAFPTPNRLGSSTLIEAGGKRYVFDAGRGVIHRFTEAGFARQPIDGMFFTHLHSDHVVGFPALWLQGWLFSRRDTPLLIFGPVGTKSMVDALKEAFAFDISYRIADDGVPATGIEYEVTEIEDGFVWEDGSVAIRAIEVDHAPVEPAFGYRIDVGEYSVALSGDTRYSEAFIEAVQGVDLLIYEVADASEQYLAENPPFTNIVRAHHTTAPEAGMVFSRVSPRLAVYTHVVIPDLTFEELLELTDYDGPLIIGEDLMSFDIGEEITHGVRRGNLRTQ